MDIGRLFLLSWRAAMIAILLILSTSGPLVAQGGAAPDIPAWEQRVELKDVRVQELPAGVCDVYVGSDDRTWYVFGTTDTSKTTEGCAGPAEVKKLIETQFGEASPQIIDCKIAMFEKNGRVWFLPLKDWHLLLGYDGRTWIERRIEDGYRGRAPNHGKPGRASLNAQIGETLFFVRSRGIDRFDGKEWRYDRFTGGTMFDHIQLIDDGGGGPFALCVGTKSALWRYTDGAWTQIAVPGQGDKPQYPTMIALAGKDRVLALGYASTPELIFLDGKRDGPPEELAGLIVQLGADAYTDREEAQRRIAELGPTVRPSLEEAFKQHADDPEVVMRLRRLLDGMRLPGGPACIIGPYAVREAFGGWSHASGRLIVSANAIVREGRELGKGSVLRDAKGTCTFLPAEEFPRIFHNSTNLTHAGWIAVEDGKKVWFSGSGDDANAPPCLLDLETMRVVKRVGNPQFCHLVAVKRDGTLFLRQRWFNEKLGAFRSEGKPIVAYRPDSPEWK